MKKTNIILLIVIAVMVLAGCGKAQPVLRGTYQSEVGKMSVVVSFSFYQEDGRFDEYFDSTKVDTGTFEKLQENTYILKSDLQDFEITLSEENSFDITLTKLNGGKPIRIRNAGDTPAEFDPGSTITEIETYRALLD